MRGNRQDKNLPVLKKREREIACESMEKMMGQLAKRGRNIEYIVKKVQKAINEVESWSRMWGF